MDFFHGLDQGRYGAFKTSMLNGWAAGAFNPPDTVNKINRTAGSWVKPVPMGRWRHSSFIRHHRRRGKTSSGQEETRTTGEKEPISSSGSHGSGSSSSSSSSSGHEQGRRQKVTTKDRSNYKCWSCNKFGHLTYSKLCPNYKKKSEEMEVSANAMWQEYKASMYVTICWADQEDEEELMVSNAVHVTQALRPAKVLFDNQADISIIHPMLLREVQKAQRRMRAKGVGGPQLIVDEEGILDGLMDFMVFVMITLLLEYCKSPSLQLNRIYYLLYLTCLNSN